MQFFVEGKRPLTTKRDHTDEPVFVSADDISVLRVKFVHEAWHCSRSVLRDFFHEGTVI
jgi:hypothetical protein